MEALYQAKKENKKIYNKLYYQKNKVALTDRLWCSVCHGTLCYYNTSNHYKTKKHREGEVRATKRQVY